jgi:hypothetical protein
MVLDLGRGAILGGWTSLGEVVTMVLLPLD